MQSRDDQFTITFDTAARQLGFTSNIALFKRLRELHVLKDSHTIASHYKNQGLFFNNYDEFTPPGHSKSITTIKLVISKKGMNFLRTLFGKPDDTTRTTPPMGATDSTRDNARAQTTTF